MKIKDQLLALMKSLGMELGEKEKDLVKGLEEIDKKLETPAPPAPAGGPTQPSAADEQLRRDLAALQQQMTDLLGVVTEEKKQRQEAQRTLADRMKADAAKRVEDALAKHEKTGQVIPAMKEHFKKILEADFDTGMKVIEALPVDPAAKKAADAAGGGKGKGDDKQTPPTHRPLGLEGMANQQILKGIQELSQTSN